MINEYGAAFTKDKKEALKYRVRDTQIQRHRIKAGLPQYEKYTNLFHYDQSTRTYWLPPSAGQAKVPTDVVKNIQENSFLRDYQKEALLGLDYSKRGNAIIATTGMGKSYMIMGLALAFKTALIIAPSVEIVKGLTKKFAEQGLVSPKPITSKAIKDLDCPPPFLIITRDTLRINREKINSRSFNVMLIDELHYISDKFKGMINSSSCGAIVGLTATMRRKELDEEGFQDYFGSVYEIQGEPLPMVVFKYTNRYHMDLKEYVELTKDFKDPTSTEALRAIVNNCQTRQKMVEQMLESIMEVIDPKHLIIFCDRNQQIDKFVERFGDKFTVITGNRKDPIGDKAIIGNAQCVGTGFDVPHLRIGVLTFSTKWRNTIEQLGGRSRREDGEKKYGIFLDIQDTFIINGRTRHFGSKERNEMYDLLGWKVIQLPDVNHKDFKLYIQKGVTEQAILYK